MTTSYLDDTTWRSLLRRIENRKCTPFLGAGVSHPPLPLGGEIARAWAKDHDYPLPDTEDLSRVAQFLATTQNGAFAKEELWDLLFKTPKLPDFNSPDEPHTILASLPCPLYITTNYDDYMVQALTATGRKTPSVALCRWNTFTRDLDYKQFVSLDEVEPTPEKPVVFYLHGHKAYPESFVLTEDDYFDFLISISRNDDLISNKIKTALRYTSLLFIGYSLRDLDFRVLYRGLVKTDDATSRGINVTVQLPRDEQPGAKLYLEEYFAGIDCKVYWGTAREFVAELSERWKDMPHGN